MYCSMQGALKTKDVFLGVVSHEIRTPLQTILGYQSLLEQTVQGKEQREYLDAMKDASFRLLQLVNHLLVLPALRPDRARYRRRPLR